MPDFTKIQRALRSDVLDTKKYWPFICFFRCRMGSVIYSQSEVLDRANVETTHTPNSSKFFFIVVELSVEAVREPPLQPDCGRCISRLGVFSIHLPPDRVVDDVLPDAVQFIFIADNAFVIIALP